MIIFIAKNKIPRRFKWHYGIEGNIIIRHHSVKWRAKFNLPRIFEIFQEEFSSDQCAPTPAMVKAQQIPTAASSQGSQPSLPPINLGSPSSSGSKPKTVQSSHSKSKIKPKLSRDELLQLARQITDQVEAQSVSSSDHSEEGSVSAHSSEESTNHYLGPEIQDAQDPFDYST